MTRPRGFARAISAAVLVSQTVQHEVLAAVAAVQHADNGKPHG